MSRTLHIFQDALLANDPSLALPLIKPHPRLSPAQQFAIYAQGYRLRMAAAIASDYPHVREQAGEEVFEAAVQRYIALHASRSYNLDFYPHPFGEWFAAQSDVPWLADLARVEGAIARVFMLPDSLALDGAALENLTPEALGARHLALRTAHAFLALSYPVDTWMSAARSEASPAAPPPRESWLLLVRHQHEVRRLPLEEAGFALLQALGQGMSVEQALDSVIAEDSRRLSSIASHLQVWFAEWVTHGVFAAT